MLIRTILSLSCAEKALIFLCLDMTLVPLAFFAAMILCERSLTGGADLMGAGALLVGEMVIAAGLSQTFGLSRMRLKDYQGDAAIRSMLLGAGLGSAAWLGQALGAGPDAGPEGGIAFHVVFALVYFCAHVVARRLLAVFVTGLYRRSPQMSRVMIYGAGRTGMALAQELRHASDMVVYAFLDDNPLLAGMTANGLPIHPALQAERLCARYRINRIILAIPATAPERQNFVSRRLAGLGLEVLTLPAFAQIYGGEALLSRLMPSRPAQLLQRAPLDAAATADCAAYAGRTVLITGAGGSIGLELCRQIVACRPERIVMLDLSEFALFCAEQEIRAIAGPFGVSVDAVLGSVCDAPLVAQTLARYRIDVVLHAAAYKHVPIVETNVRVGIANNALGTAVMARAARDAGVARFVLISTDKAVRPGNLMGASKRIAELVVQDLAERAPRTIFSIVRFGNVLGSSGSVIPRFQEQIARGGPVLLTDPRVTRYFMTIEEASRLVLLSGSFAEGGDVHLLDMGKPQRIADLARRMIQAAGYSVRDADHPDGDIAIKVTGLRPGEKLHEELMLHAEVRPTLHPRILSIKEDRLSEIAAASGLRALRDAVERGSEAEVIAAVARMVPDYAPQSLPETALQCRIVQGCRNTSQIAQ